MRANPGAIGSIPPAKPPPASLGHGGPSPSSPQGGQPGTQGLAMGASPVAGDPGWGSFGRPAEQAAVEGWVIITAPRTGRGDSAAEECPCLLPRCHRDAGKQPDPTAPLDAGLPTGKGSVVPAPPGSGWHRHTKTPGLRKGSGAGDHGMPAPSLSSLAGCRAGCRAMPCCAMLALPGSASGAPGRCARGTGVTQADTSPSRWHHPTQQTPLGAQPHFGVLPTDLGCPGRRSLACPAPAMAGL